MWDYYVAGLVLRLWLVVVFVFDACLFCCIVFADVCGFGGVCACLPVCCSVFLSWLRVFMCFACWWLLATLALGLLIVFGCL